jgi:hypothetical protein
VSLVVDSADKTNHQLVLSAETIPGTLKAEG